MTINTKPIHSFFSRYHLILILVIASGLRISLSLLNTEANDDHIEPIMLWMEVGTYPSADDCWECFQPPFFYGIVKYTSEALKLTEFEEIRTVFQIINLLLSLLILYIIYLAHKKLEVSKLLSSLLFAFWAFNPKLIGINAQATNDTVIILLGMLFSILLFRQLSSKPKLKQIWILALLTVIAAISKGSGLVFAAIFIFALIYWIITVNDKRVRLNSVIILLMAPLCIALFGSYYAKYKEYGEPFKINQTKAEPAQWFQADEEFKGRLGVKTLWGTYFSFRFISLVEQPYTDNTWSDDYPIHRESFLTQLYGQFNNVLFERHPYTWINTDRKVMNLNRGIYLLSLPLFLFFIYAWMKSLILGIKRYFQSKELDLSFLHALFILAMLIFLIKYSYDYRVFANMKVIFLFPAFYSMLFVFNSQATSLKRWTQKAIVINLVIVSLLQLINVSVLIDMLK